MKKQIVFLLNVTVLAGSLSIYSCKKKHDATPAATPTPAPASIQASINGTTYKASTQIVVPNLIAITGNGNYSPSIASNGSYINVTYPDTSTWVKPYTYQYIIYQANIVSPGDTMRYIINISSKSVITTGTYPLTINTPTSPGNSYGTAGFSNTNFVDSLVTGTINITTLDRTNKLASGTFSFTSTGTKGSSPATLSLTNGIFTNLILQEF
jgi:hypothetical protein